MPLYEYTCPECQMPFSVRRSFADYDQPAVCPACGAQGHRRLSGVVAFSADAGGQRRAVAGGSPCSACAATVGCSGGCGVRR